MTLTLARELKEALGVQPGEILSLHGGCIGEVYRVSLPPENAFGTETVVVKIDDSKSATLSIEGYMLQYLREHSQLPVPTVYHSVDSLLVIEWLPGDSRFSARAQEHAAELLADLHSVQAPQYGLERDTLIGGLRQPNSWTTSWLDFFREHRILYMAHQGLERGVLPTSMLKRLERFCDNLGQWLEEPPHPSLLHGDVWTTNILAENNRITGFIDPAVYYGHAEIELAFSTLFGTFSEPFFKRYDEIRPIPPGFFELRRDLYNLYPLLVRY
jgi:fructosamine-3-kinase